MGDKLFQGGSAVEAYDRNRNHLYDGRRVSRVSMENFKSSLSFSILFAYNEVRYSSFSWIKFSIVCQECNILNMRRKLEQSKMKLSGNLIRRMIVISKKKKRINLFDERDRLKVSKLKIIYIYVWQIIILFVENVKLWDKKRRF